MVSAILLVGFFLYPFSWVIFGPLCVGVTAVSLWNPLLGLCLWIASSLPALVVPIALNSRMPYFSGCEPLFFSFWLGVSFRFLWTATRLPTLPFRALLPLCLFVTAVFVSGTLVWLNLRVLPEDWWWWLTWDALSRIYFWRWTNPFHFLRTGLLLLEGVVALLLVIPIYRLQPSRCLRWASWSFLLSAAALQFWSLVELTFRGKELSIYPGFGPVFTDRNAYAAFWVMVVPLAIGCAMQGRGWFRRVPALVAMTGILLCLFSFSLTGIITLVALGALALLLHGRYLVEKIFTRKETVTRWFIAALLILFLAAISFPFFVSDSLRADLSTRADVLEEHGMVTGLYRQRARGWSAAVNMIHEYPLLGRGIGEYYQNLSQYADPNTRDLPFFVARRENAHNYFLQIGAETGLIGLIAFGSLIGLIVIPALKSRSLEKDIDRDATPLRTAIGYSLLGLCIFSLGQHPLLRVEFQVFFWLLLGILLASGFPGATARSASHSGVFLIMSLIVVVLAGAIQNAFAPLPVPERLEYGLYPPQPPRKWVRTWTTSELAFLMEPVDRTYSFLRISAPDGSGKKFVQLFLNGRSEEFSVGGDAEARRFDLEQEQPQELIFGVRVSPVSKRPFASDWGQGIEVELKRTPRGGD